MSDLQESVVEFLDSASNQPQPKNCTVCGTITMYRDAVFFYEEKKWKVRLPICPVCDSDTSSVA